MAYVGWIVAILVAGTIAYFLGSRNNKLDQAQTNLGTIEQDKKLHDKVKEDTANLSDADLADSLREWVHK